MTHLARADERDDPGTRDQIACFSSIDKTGGVQTSLANSAGVLAWPESHGDWVRPGIMLYGISPFLDGSGESEGLRPVMTFTSPGRLLVDGSSTIQNEAVRPLLS